MNSKVHLHVLAWVYLGFCKLFQKMRAQTFGFHKPRVETNSSSQCEQIDEQKQIFCDIPSGIAPDNWLFDRFRDVKNVKLVSWVGIVPLSWLFERSNDSSAITFPRLFGIGPVSRFLDRFRLVNPVNDPISLGMVPDSLFPDKSKDMMTSKIYV